MRTSDRSQRRAVEHELRNLLQRQGDSWGTCDDVETLIVETIDCILQHGPGGAGQRQPVSSMLLIHAAARCAEVALDNLSINIASECRIVYLDRSRTLQLLLNLVNNAERHGGGVESINVERSAAGSYVSFSVMDRNGLWFDIDTQRGTGLWVAETIAVEHGGWLEQLDCADGRAIMRAVLCDRGDVCYEEARRLVVIVDDDEVVRSMLRHGIEQRGFDAVGVGTISDAVDVLQHRHATWVIVDANLSDSNGVAFARALSSRVAYVAVLSGDAPWPNHGVQHWIQKPIMLDTLVDHLLEVDRRSRCTHPAIACAMSAANIVIAGGEVAGEARWNHAVRRLGAVAAVNGPHDVQLLCQRLARGAVVDRMDTVAVLRRFVSQCAVGGEGERSAGTTMVSIPA